MAAFPSSSSTFTYLRVFLPTLRPPLQAQTEAMFVAPREREWNQAGAEFIEPRIVTRRVETKKMFVNVLGVKRELLRFRNK